MGRIPLRGRVVGKGRDSILEAIAYEKRVQWVVGVVVIVLFTILAVAGILSR